MVYQNRCKSMMFIFMAYHQNMLVVLLVTYYIGNSTAFISMISKPHNLRRYNDASIDELSLLTEVDRRRNFAIISHPDAGKTTLTEKLLLFGGAIHDAGTVRARANQRKVTSDWMEIERQRGISVTSTVLSFEFELKNIMYKLNLLDTPGHQDFSEDTYRTLAAADNCVMLIDAGKGIEERTRKLYDVCRMRQLPIFTFANKMDRPAIAPVKLIEELESEFKLDCCPMNWPIGDGPDFQGVYDRISGKVHLFERGDRGARTSSTSLSVSSDSDSALLLSVIGPQLYSTLLQDIELLEQAYNPPDWDKIQSGQQTLLFFGSAMTNFGVELFLHTFLQYAARPRDFTALITAPSSTSNNTSSPPTVSTVDPIQTMTTSTQSPSAAAATSTSSTTSVSTVVSPYSNDFTGFVFKLQTNLDPRHRDCMAFLRVCSGAFTRGMKVTHSRSRRSITLSQGQSLFAQDRLSLSSAFPGDVIGIHNPGGLLAIGDTLYACSSSTGREKEGFRFPDIPSFSPEIFSRISNLNHLSTSRYDKGLTAMLDEGAVQLLRERRDVYSNSQAMGSPILAAVGALQFEVVKYRLKAEYDVECKLEPLEGYTLARWVESGWDSVDLAEKNGKLFSTLVCKDKWQRPVVLFKNEWKIGQLLKEEPGVRLSPYGRAYSS